MEEVERTMKMLMAGRRKAAAATAEGSVLLADEALTELAVVCRRSETLMQSPIARDPSTYAFIVDLRKQAEKAAGSIRHLLRPAATVAAAPATPAVVSPTRPAAPAPLPPAPCTAALAASSLAPREQPGDSYYMRVVKQALGARELLAGCRAARQKFSDPLFPPCTASLFRGEAPHKSAQGVADRARWRRPPQGAVAITQSTQPGDVIQGVLGDCWFLGALSLVATKKGLFSELLPLCDPEIGFYVVRLFRNRTRVEVVVDDMLPCDDNGVPLFGRNRNPKELWVSIIEKAYAKVCGSYYSMETGNESDGLVDLTGGVSFTLMLNERREASKDLVWRLLCAYQSKGYLMGCANNRTGGNVMGIVPNHAYGILGLFEIEAGQLGRVCLVRVRNPWGDVEWQGTWSDRDPVWNYVLPTVRNSIGFSNSEDGTFFMCFDDFENNFEKIYLCKDVPQGWTSVSEQGSWIPGVTAGGCLNHPTWVFNPQYLVHVTRPSQAFIVLSQGDARKYGAEGGYEAAIGMTILRSTPKSNDGFRRVCPPDASEIVERTAFVATRERSVAITLDPKFSPYTVVPATYEPAFAANFKVTVFSDTTTGASICPCAEWPVKRDIQSEWTPSNCGGWDEYECNPEFALCCSSAILRVDALVAHGGAPPAVGIIVADGDRIVAQTEVMRERSVGILLELGNSRQRLSVFPCTHESGWLGRFVISMWTKDLSATFAPVQ